MHSPAPSIGSRRQSEVVMIEVYSFLAMFLLQILVVSVIYPIRFARLIRAGLARVPAERLVELYPGIDVARTHERFLARYRVANAVVVVLGLLLLGRFFSSMQHPGWDDGAVGNGLFAYFLLQNVPVVLMAWLTTRFHKVRRFGLPEAKRTATLQRRGLFDFLSPRLVVLAVLSYSLFAAFIFYVARHPFPGFGGPLANIGILTLGYIFLGIVVYRQIYGRKSDPLQTHAERMHTIRVVVNAIAWCCILVPMFGAMAIARQMLDLDTWGPFVGSLVFLTMGLMSFGFLSATPRQQEADGLRSSPVRQ
jgi:hypothetical protein